MANTTIKKLAHELNLSVGTVSKALKDSHEISIETKRKVHELVNKLNYVPNPYASSLRKRKSKTIAVVLPEVADSFFSLAINGIEAVAQDKGYHVLIYLTHENFSKEQNILKDFTSGRVDGILISVSRETTQGNHICDVQTLGIPVVFFDRVCDEVVETKENGVVFCTNNEAYNYNAIKNLMSNKDHPDGLIASVEKLTITVYHVCNDLNLQIPQDVKVISFSNLSSALILNPSLTTITQPAFEMGEAAASLLFNALEKRNFILKGENIILPSVLNIRNSTK